MRELPSDHPLLRLFHELRRRSFLLGPDDLFAVHSLLAEGYGWSSRAALRNLCRALWAKSHDEQLVLDSLFDQLIKEEWRLSDATVGNPANDGPAAALPPVRSIDAEGSGLANTPLDPEVVSAPGRLPRVRVPETLLSTRPFVLVPQHPLGFRSIAQAWRRLRRPIRFGPATELDIEATIAHRARIGVATPPVLRPQRRNTARVLLLVDRHGSMAPFDDFVTEVARAIQQAAQLAHSVIFYFHDLPSEGTSDAALAHLQETMFPTADAVLADIIPMHSGWLYRDPELLRPVALSTVLRDHADARAVVVISDAGAARGRYDIARVLDSLALAMALRTAGATSAWMNPLPRSRWHSTTAGEIARHVAMFPLDRSGMHMAVNYLRGQPVPIEQPV
jgi:hypothetical protein